LVGYNTAVDYIAANNFTRLGAVQPTYLFNQTFAKNDLIYITVTGFVDSQGQIPNGIGMYQYVNTNSLSSRPDVTSFTSSNGFVFLGATIGSYDNGPGFYRYTNTTSQTKYTRATQVSAASGFAFIGPTIQTDFEEVEVCFYHVRQKVNPVANDGDYKFIGSTKLGANDNRLDAIMSLPHLSTPVPYVAGTATVDSQGTAIKSLDIDKPAKNRGLYLQRGDALYIGLYASSATSVNYAPGVTVIAQGGYY
jgi:hypothetical protein